MDRRRARPRRGTPGRCVYRSNSCNCLSPQVLVLDADWPQQGFLDRFRTILPRSLGAAHYPGFRAATRRWRARIRREPGAHRDRVPSGRRRERARCRTPLALDSPRPLALDTRDRGEAFGPVLAIQYLNAGGDPVAFLDEAVAWRTSPSGGPCRAPWSCILRSPRTARSASSAIADLHYGCIGVNIWTSLGYGLPGATWGAYPGESLDNVASGIGVVRNAYLLRGVEKTVVRAPLKSLVQIVSPEDGKLPLSAKPARCVTSCCDPASDPSARWATTWCSRPPTDTGPNASLKSAAVTATPRFGGSSFSLSVAHRSCA